jgi:phosphoglycolate phosphatase
LTSPGGPRGRSHSQVDPLEGLDLLVFDKDGTLIDFQLMWGDWARELASALEKATQLRMQDTLPALLGVDPGSGLVQPHGLLAATPMARIREVVVDALREEGLDARAAELAVARTWQPPDAVRLVRPLADLRRLLTAIRQRVAHLAVATSDDRGPTERTLAALKIEDLLSGVVCADDGYRVKPSPEGFLALCDRVGVPPDRAAMVGDSPADMAMARAAGARRAIGVLTGVSDETELKLSADILLPSIEALVPA